MSLAHLSEEVHLPQQVTEHGVDVVHLFEGTTEGSDTKLIRRVTESREPIGRGWAQTVNQTHVEMHSDSQTEAASL